MSLSKTLAVALFGAVASAQTVSVVTAVGTVTQCFANNGQSISLNVGPTPTVTVNNGGTTIVNINAPVCNSCGCNGAGCTAINVYQTTYQAFGNTGLINQIYQITETYCGVSSLPTVTTTGAPFGFTCAVSTCTVCGPTPITATLTYPVTTCPYVTGISAPSPAPAGVPAYSLCTTGLAPIATPLIAPAVYAGGSSGSGAVGAGAGAGVVYGGSGAVGGGASGSGASGAGAGAGAGAGVGVVSGGSGASGSGAVAGSGSSGAGANGVSPAPGASTTYVKSSASRPGASVALGCILGFTMALMAAYQS